MSKTNLGYSFFKDFGRKMTNEHAVKELGTD